MLFLMDEKFCFQCFCTEKYEKCVRPDKDFSLKAALQGRENKIKRLLCRNLATRLPDNRAPKPWGQAPQSGISQSVLPPYHTSVPFSTRSKRALRHYSDEPLHLLELAAVTVLIVAASSRSTPAVTGN